MSRRTILSLAASVIIGIGFVGTISTDASAYRAGVARGGVYRGWRLPWGRLPWCTTGSGGGHRCRGRCCRGRCRRRGCLLRARLLRRSRPGRLSIRLLLLRPLQSLRTDAVTASMRQTSKERKQMPPLFFEQSERIVLFAKPLRKKQSIVPACTARWRLARGNCSNSSVGRPSGAASS